MFILILKLQVTVLFSRIQSSTITHLISAILEPPLPMREPHCEAGTISLRLTPPAAPPLLLDPEEVLAPSLAPPGNIAIIKS